LFIHCQSGNLPNTPRRLLQIMLIYLKLLKHGHGLRLMRAIFEQKSLSFEIFNIDTLTNIETFILSIKNGRKYKHCFGPSRD